MSNIKCVPTKVSTLLGNEEAKRQFESLLKLQWEEVDPRRKTTELNVDFDKYLEMEGLGVHFIVVAYEEGNLLGYNSMLLTPSPHTGELTALTDTIFIKKGSRHTGVGREMIRVAEEVARSKGAEHYLVTFKNEFKHDGIVEDLGFFNYETVYAKYIGDE